MTNCELDERVTRVTEEFFPYGEIINKSIENKKFDLIFKEGS